MAQALKRLAAQAANIEVLKKFSSEQTAKRAGPQEGDAAVKKAAKEVLGAVVALDAAGNLTNPIDAKVAEIFSSRRAEVIEGIEAATKKGVLNPLDAYDVYYKILSDSGALDAALPAPNDLRQLDAMRAKWACSCAGCTLCNACSACAACALSVVAGTVATGVVGATAGTISSWAA